LSWSAQAPILAIQRGIEISISIKGSTVTLLTVKSPDSSGYDPQTKGENLIQTTLRTLGLNPDKFNSEVVVADDVRQALMKSIKGYDTVCIGATRSTSVRKALFGSIPEEIGENMDGTVVITRGREYKPRTVTEGIIERLSK
jgi:basic amino acid/polyamine antiporter, APA family